MQILKTYPLKAYRLSELIFIFILKVANIRCFKACWILLSVSFSYRIRQCFCLIPRFDWCHVLSSSTTNFAHAQTLSRMSSLSGRMNIARVNIGSQKGGFSKLCVKIKKRCYTDLHHFSTRKHKLVSFFGRIIF
jgi:hypothetical protein